MMGASWQAPLPKWAQFRRDVAQRARYWRTHYVWASTRMGIRSSCPILSRQSRRGDVYGALLNIHLNPKWLWSSEYAFSRDNANTADPTSKREFGRAWRTGHLRAGGQDECQRVLPRCGREFRQPGQPQPDAGQPAQLARRGFRDYADHDSAGTFGLTYTFLANNVHPTTSDELFLHSFDETWSKPFGVKTNLVVDARQSLTETGTVPASLEGMPPEQTGAQDQRDVSGNINLSRQIGTVTMSGGRHARLESQQSVSRRRHDHFFAHFRHESGHAAGSSS